MNIFGRDRVALLPRPRIIHLPNWRVRLTMHLHDGTEDTFMNSSSVMAHALGLPTPNGMPKTRFPTSES